MVAVNPLIDTEELAARLDEVGLYDIRWALTDPGHGRASYESGHIPGAVFVDLDTDLSGASGPGRHPLPPVSEFAETLGRLGLRPADEVVVYDDTSGTIASRMWWMLRSLGHSSSRLLDGGYREWLLQGRDIETGEREPTPAIYPVTPGYAGVVERADLPGRTILDARAPERYRGENEPIDPKAGHIPGAINKPTADNLRGEGTFLDPQDLADHYAGLGPSPVVSCGSGVSACHDALAMTIAGLEMPDIYIGSFSEWSRLDLPVATGPTP